MKPKKLKKKKKNFIPGLTPIYDEEMQNKFSSNNYQDNQMT